MKLVGEGLAVERGGRCVFRDVDVAAAGGELVLLAGPNGSGKTSLIKLIAGVLEPAAGKLSFTGGDDELTIGQQAHLIGHQQAIKPALTVLENMQFWAGFFGGDRAMACLDAFGLGELSGLPAGVLSAGQRRRLSLSRLFLSYRPIWLLDEPNVGLDGSSLAQLAHHMREHLKSGGLIVAAAHTDLGVKAHRTIELEGK
jgi:heme exporter protein A